MPIRPENRKLYPVNWRAISRRIRFERAGGRCECTGQCLPGGGRHVCGCPEYPNRCTAIHGRKHPRTGARVVLTVAHLDHDPRNCADKNLLALCQLCHNRMDAQHRADGRKARRS